MCCYALQCKLINWLGRNHTVNMCTTDRHSGIRACALILGLTLDSIFFSKTLWFLEALTESTHQIIRFDFKTWIVPNFSLCLLYSVHHWMLLYCKWNTSKFASIRTEYEKHYNYSSDPHSKICPKLRQATHNVQPSQPPKAKVATIHKESSGRISCIAHV